MHPLLQLPHELWGIILDHLPVEDRRTWLFLSRLHHDLAVASLFSTIHVYFGAWELSDEGLLICGDDEESYVIEEQAEQRSLEILDYISASYHFARCVQKMVVHAYARSSSAYHRHTLCKALRFLTHLQAFHWVHLHPGLTEDVVNALVSSCTQLRHLRFFPMKCLDALGLERLTQLDTITISTSGLNSEDDVLGFDFTGLHAFLEGNRHSLRRLALSSQAMQQVPLRLVSNLTHLEITDVDGSAQIDIVVHHAERLQSLSLVDVRDPLVIGAFEASPESLPLLRELKIICWPPDFRGDISNVYVQVANFLRGRARLRRVDFSLPPSDRNVASTLIHVLRDLSDLTSLGLDVPEDSDDTFIRFLAGCLPEGLVALRLSIAGEPSDLQADRFLPVLERIAELPALTLLALSYEDAHQPMFFTGDLATDAKHLLVLALGRQIWDVHHCPQSQQNTVNWTRWSPRRAVLRLVEYFDGCEPEEWLLRYHRNYGLPNH